MIINKSGHKTKMAAMPIYGKKPLKNSSSQELLNLLQRKLIGSNAAIKTRVLGCMYKS